MRDIPVRQHTRRKPSKPSKSPIYIAKHEQLRAEVSADRAKTSYHAQIEPVGKVEAVGSAYDAEIVLLAMEQGWVAADLLEVA